MKYSMSEESQLAAIKIINSYKSQNNVMSATLIALLDERKAGDLNKAKNDAINDMPKRFPLAYRKAIAAAIIATAETEGLIE